MFDDIKKDIVKSLNALDYKDKSPKGSVDAPIVQLISKINRLQDYVTTSSCSGRIVLFAGNESHVKGGKWLVSSHDKVQAEQIEKALIDFRENGTVLSSQTNNEVEEEEEEVHVNENEEQVDEKKIVEKGKLITIENKGNDQGVIFFKLEPFVMHILCRSMEHAQSHLRIAIEAGFRESGISMGNKRKIILYIRTTSNRLELPIAKWNDISNNEQTTKKKVVTMLVQNEYIKTLVDFANAGYDDNSSRIQHYEKLIDGFLLEEYRKSIAIKDVAPNLTNFALLVPSNLASILKLSLQRIEMLDTSRLLGNYPGDTSRLAIPLLCKSADEVAMLFNAIRQDLESNKETNSSGGVVPQHLDASTILSICQMIPYDTPLKQRKKAQHTKRDLIELIQVLVEKCAENVGSNIIPQDALDFIPEKPLEIISDVAVLRSEHFSHPFFIRLAEVSSDSPSRQQLSLWRLICDYFEAQRLIRMFEVDQGQRRSSRATLLYPKQDLHPTCWVEIKQHSIYYQLDLLRSMFSSGNVNERHRMATVVAETVKERKGKLVVNADDDAEADSGGATTALQLQIQNDISKVVVCDLFAGIGYFTLPMLSHPGNESVFVHACEWNYASLEALNNNLSRNGCKSRCLVYPGDCSKSVDNFEGKCDHVLMGLLPTSLDYLPVAVKALHRTKGGWLHVHLNVAEEGLSNIGRELEIRINAVLATVKNNQAPDLENDGASLNSLQTAASAWKCECRHVEKVKNYAPKVLHVVCDVFCKVELSAQDFANDLFSKGEKLDEKHGLLLPNRRRWYNTCFGCSSSASTVSLRTHQNNSTKNYRGTSTSASSAVGDGATGVKHLLGFSRDKFKALDIKDIKTIGPTKIISQDMLIKFTHQGDTPKKIMEEIGMDSNMKFDVHRIIDFSSSLVSMNKVETINDNRHALVSILKPGGVVASASSASASQVEFSPSTKILICLNTKGICRVTFLHQGKLFVEEVGGNVALGFGPLYCVVDITSPDILSTDLRLFLISWDELSINQMIIMNRSKKLIEQLHFAMYSASDNGEILPNAYVQLIKDEIQLKLS